jgi:hypothetical protein
MAKYTVDGLEYVSVTSVTGQTLEPIILNIFSANASVDYILNHSDTLVEGNNIVTTENVLDEARKAYTEASKGNMEIGSNVHSAIEQHIKGHDEEWIKKTFLEDTTALDCYNQFLEWENKFNPTYYWSEKSVFEPEMCYAGTLDCVAEIDGIMHLIDWKTSNGGAISDSYWMQLAAYMHTIPMLPDKVDISSAHGGTFYELEYPKLPSYPTVGSVLKMDKKDGEWEFVTKDAKFLKPKFEAFSHLLDYYYTFKKRRINNKRGTLK